MSYLNFYFNKFYLFISTRLKKLIIKLTENGSGVKQEEGWVRHFSNLLSINEYRRLSCTPQKKTLCISKYQGSSFIIYISLPLYNLCNINPSLYNLWDQVSEPTKVLGPLHTLMQLCSYKS
jgi:hypothetical protein